MGLDHHADRFAYSIHLTRDRVEQERDCCGTAGAFSLGGLAGSVWCNHCRDGLRIRGGAAGIHHRTLGIGGYNPGFGSGGADRAELGGVDGGNVDRRG